MGWAERFRDEKPLFDFKRAWVEGAERIVEVSILRDLRNAAAVYVGCVKLCFV